MDQDAASGLDPRRLEELRDRISRSAFHGWAGIELTQLGGGRAVVALALEPHHFNPQGIVHGGIIATLADTAIGLAVRSQLRAGLTHRTAQLNVHYLAKGEGERLVAAGRCLHVGSRMGYGEAEVLDADGHLLARGSATFIVLPAPGSF